jgi:hypothetical protein
VVKILRAVMAEKNLMVVRVGEVPILVEDMFPEELILIWFGVPMVLLGLDLLR